MYGRTEFMSRESKKTEFFMGTIDEPQVPDQNFYADQYESIQQAVEACAAAGGGTVTVPSGKWQTGPVRLQSNIRLYFEAGAEVSFSSRREDYLPVVFTRWEGTECYNYCPLIYAYDCENIVICGEGRLLGNGTDWWEWKQLQDSGANALYDAAVDGVPVKKRIYGTEEMALRPSFLQLVGCRRILIEGITLIDGPQWTLHPVYCEDVVIRNVHIHTEGPNTDGLNPDSCRNVVIEDSDFYTGDDCIAINAGLNEDGWRVGRPCENIEIRRCRMTGGHGGVVIGSAISGSVHHVYAHDCDISGTMQGLRLKSMRGRGGLVEDIRFENIRIKDVSDEALQINMFYEFSTVMPKTDRPSVFRRISFSNIQASGARVGLMLKGLPEQKLQDITLREVAIAAKESLVCTDVNGLNMERVVLQPETE